MAIDYLTELKKYAMQETAGIDSPTFERVCQDIVREFCEQSQGWIEELDPMNLRVDVRDYELEAPNNYSAIILPLRVRIFEDDAEPVHPDAEQQAPYFQYNMDVVPGRCTLTLVYTPDRNQTKALKVQVALRPRRDKRLICERLFDDWYQIWAFGVMARLMMMPNKQWSDHRMANYYQGKYWEGIGRARIDRNRRFMNREMFAFSRFKFAEGGFFNRGRKSF